MDHSLLNPLPLEHKTAIVCGASAGIGKETARYMARLGANVCIIARNPDKLEQAASEIRAVMPRGNRFVETIACDTSDFIRLKPLLTEFIQRRGTPDYLINNVGYSHPQYAHLLSFDDYKKNMDVNYLGQLAPTLILLPYFMSEKKGHIAFVSSMMGYFGIMGFAAYAPSKFALAGLAEVLRHELKPYQIRISVIYPPDTDTPGLKAENLTKPLECKMLSENVRLMRPEKVAEIFVNGILKNKFFILPGGAGVVWRMYRHFPRLVHWILDLHFRRARKKCGKIEA